MNLDSSDRPVSSMPGSHHAVPPGTMCQVHRDVPAVTRVQGETDSFGCEYICACQQCVDQYRAETEEAYQAPRYCDWCSSLKTKVRAHRDMDEGMGGPVYQVCADCRKRELEALAAEEAANPSEDYFEDWDDGPALDDGLDFINEEAE